MNLLPPKEAAKRIGCSRAHIYALVDEGKLKRYYIGTKGGTLRVSDEDVDRFIRESESPLPQDAA